MAIRVRQFRFPSAAICAVFSLFLCAGCSWLSGSAKPADRTTIPLTPVIWFAPSATTASIPYQDACSRASEVSLADSFVGAVPKKLKLVFTDVTTESQPNEPIAPEGVIEVGVGVKRIDLAVSEKGPGHYPARVTVGVDMIFLARDGTLLLSKKLQGIGLGMVELVDQSCEIHGLGEVVRSAVESVADEMAKQLEASSQIREFAAQRQTWLPLSIRPRSVSPAPTTAATTPAVPIAPVESPPSQAPIAPSPAIVSFRAIIREENRDLVLQPNESVVAEIEVKNDGQVEAKDVKILFEGKPELVAIFSPELTIGLLQPGEIRRTSVSKRVTGPEDALYGELVLKLRTATPTASAPPTKIFTFGRRPKQTTATTALDVDQAPKPFIHPRGKPLKPVVISIGIEQFSDDHMHPVKYAGRDAEVMAEHLQSIGSVPSDRIRVLLNGQATKQDLEETFEQWLPKRATTETVLYVFFAGRALMDGVTGAISLVPYDGSAVIPNGLYAIRRLQESLNTLPVQRIIMMFDVSLDPTPGANLAVTPIPHWDEGVTVERIDQEMWMVGNRTLQDAHVYEPGKHGLFTYNLLRGLQGLGDVDRDGTVTAGELCTYVRGQVASMARELFGNKQEPLCLPQTGQRAMVRIYPLAKGNNPKPSKPSSLPKDESTEVSPQVPGPTRVGP